MTEAEELRALIREAHGAIKDLQRETRSARKLWAELREETHAEYEKVVKDGLDEFGEALDKAIGEATASVFKRFDELSAMLLGEDKTSQRQGKNSIPDLLQALRTVERIQR